MPFNSKTLPGQSGFDNIIISKIMCLSNAACAYTQNNCIAYTQMNTRRKCEWEWTPSLHVEIVHHLQSSVCSHCVSIFLLSPFCLCLGCSAFVECACKRLMLECLMYQSAELGVHVTITPISQKQHDAWIKYVTVLWLFVNMFVTFVDTGSDYHTDHLSHIWKNLIVCVVYKCYN